MRPVSSIYLDFGHAVQQFMRSLFDPVASSAFSPAGTINRGSPCFTEAAWHAYRACAWPRCSALSSGTSRRVEEEFGSACSICRSSFVSSPPSKRLSASLIRASTSRDAELAGADNARIHEVGTPIHNTAGISLGLQRRQHLLPNTVLGPAT